MAHDCDHCDASFDTKRDRLSHALDEHDDELSSHDRDSLKRELNRLESQAPDTTGLAQYRTLGIAVVAVLALVGGGYGLVSAGVITVNTDPASSTGNVTLGAPGSTHEHTQFTVTIEGERVDFARPQYQVGQTQNRYVHFEGGDGVTIHKHATGVTVAYALDTLGFTINDTCLSAPQDSEWGGETFCEDPGSLTTTVGGSEVDPANAVINDGQPIRVTYTTGN